MFETTQHGDPPSADGIVSNHRSHATGPSRADACVKASGLPLTGSPSDMRLALERRSEGRSGTLPLRTVLLCPDAAHPHRIAALLGEIVDTDLILGDMHCASDLEALRWFDANLVLASPEHLAAAGRSLSDLASGAPDAIIVLVSDSDRHGPAAFELGATDYLVEPVTQARLVAMLEKVNRERACRATMEALAGDDVEIIHVPDPHGGRDVPLRDVVWMRASRGYVLIRTAEKTHILRVTMGELEDTLPEAFARTHRSAFVNLAHVRRWSSSAGGRRTLVMADGTAIPVGPSYLARIRRAVRGLDALASWLSPIGNVADHIWS